MAKMTEAERTARDPRFAGLRESEHTAFYRVPYSAPGSKGGWLKIYATSPEDAVVRAKAWHASKMRQPSGTRATPRPRLEYGEPMQVSPESGPTYWTEQAKKQTA